MTLVVQKFGGTSVADLDRLRAVAERVQRALADGEQVAVVVSAMAGTTDQLVDWVRQIGGSEHDRAEYDTAERLAREAHGQPARSTQPSRR